jgi:outer membrane lipoprotein-sorting protein
VPKTEMGFAKATIWIDPADGTLRQFEVVDANGLSRRVRLTNIRMNAATEASAFVFTPPAGVKVFEQPASR